MDAESPSFSRRLMDCHDVCKDLQQLTELVVIAQESLGAEGSRDLDRASLMLDLFLSLAAPYFERLDYQLRVLRKSS